MNTKPQLLADLDALFEGPFWLGERVPTPQPRDAWGRADYPSYISPALPQAACMCCFCRHQEATKGDTLAPIAHNEPHQDHHDKD